MVESASEAGGRLALLEALLRAGEEEPAAAWPRRAAGEDAPLSPGEEQLWLAARMTPGDSAYNVAFALSLRGELSAARLGASLGDLTARHEVLRCSYPEGAGGPRRRIAASVEAALPVIDLAGLLAAPRERERTRLGSAGAAQPFDLSRGPLLRALLLCTGRGEHWLLLATHHIVCDGWSVGVLCRDLGELYAARCGGRRPALPAPPQYGDFALWQRRALGGEPLEEKLAGWRARLGAEPAPLALPLDRPRPELPSGRGGALVESLPAPLAAKVRELARRAGVSLFVALLAAFKVFLLRITGSSAPAVGSAFAGREHPGSEDAVGFFVNMVVLRTDLAGDPAFSAALGAVRDSLLGALAGHDLPFSLLVAALQPRRTAGLHPFFQVSFTLSQAPAPPRFGPALRAAFEEVDNGSAKWDLMVEAVDAAGGLRLVFRYLRDLFEAATVARLLRGFVTLLGAAAERPELPLSALPLLGAAELHQATLEWNDNAAAASRLPAHRRVALRALADPDGMAVAGAEESLTYAQLERRANRLANRLRRLGIAAEGRVALCLERSPDLAVAALATLEAGGAYVPLDPDHPPERLAWMIADSGARVLVTRRRFAERLPAAAGGQPALICLERGDEGLGRSGDAAPAVEVEPAQLAYAIYTSGSTGQPKAVAVSHGALANLIDWHLRVYAPRPREASTLVASPAFDASVWELWPYLAAGCTVGIPESDVIASPARLLGWLESHETTFAFLPTPLAEAVLAERWPEGAKLRVLLTGGDELHRGAPAELPLRLVNHYGPTENAVVATWTAVAPGAAGRPPIGRPVDNVRAHVLDPALQPLPAGIAGELCLAGASLARGYLGRPALTAERFVPDPFAAPPGERGGRLYRTGDLVRQRPDGVLEYLGRIDQQVKIRGFRVELGEIEAHLARHPGVRQAAVEARDDGDGGRRLVAWVAGEPGLAAELRARCARELPAYMVPSALFMLDALPLTASGKIDRRALVVPVSAAPAERAAAAPLGPIEELLAGIWSDVLGVAAVGAGDDFFELGGHSLRATQVVARLRAELAVELPLRALFEAPRLRDLAFRIAELRDAGVAAPPPPMPAGTPPPWPLSPAQLRLWLLDRLEPGSPAYNVVAAFLVRGRLDPEALAAALAGVVERHGVLRARYREEEGGAVQEVSPAAGRRMGRVDLRGLAEPVRGGEARRLAREEASRPFDLAAGPVLRSALLRTGEQEHWLLLTVHHIAADGWSLGLLMGELGELYSARQAGRPAALPQLPVQYGDFAVWQRQWLSGEVLERQAAYWRERLAGMPAVLELPVDRPRPAVGSPRGGERRLALERELVASSQALARRHGVTPFMLLVGALACQLGGYGGREEVAMGTPIAGRTRLEIEHLIGFFANTLVLRVDLAGEPRVGELLGRVRECALSAYAHQDLPFEKLVEQLQPVRSLGHNPLFQVMLLREETLAGGREAVGEMAGAGVAGGGALEGHWATPVEVETGVSKFDLTVSWREEESGGARLRASYRRDLFDATTVQRMLGHFRTLLASMVASPEARISELALLSAAEAFQLVVEWNQTAEMSAVGEGPWSLWELLAAQAARTPEATALVAGGERWSYGELGRRAEELAVRLRGLGVGPESRVAVCLERSVELVVALWGTLLAGGAYVPLDAAYPRQRLSWIVADCGASVVVSRAALHEGLGLSGLGLPALLLEGPGERPVGCGGEPAAGWAMALPDNLAYLIYTSGSTGRPKGVAITHRSAASLVHWARRVFSDEELGGVVASTSICFDLSVFELFVPLSWGGTVVLVDDGLALARPEPAGAEEASGVRGVPVTLLNTVPSVMSELVRLAAVPSTVRVINLAGEPLRGELAARIWAGTAASRVLNLYGPSEDTTYSTWSELERGAVGEPSIGRLAGEPSIGRPVAGTRVYVLDEGLRPVGLGVTGELVLGGAGLARGYLGRPELTAERFVPDPFVAAAGERMYRTGDLGRYRVGGEIEFLGRRDHQVKVRGFRIEPGEVEVALLRQGGVEEAVVVAGEDASGERRLVAYVTPAAAVGAALRAALRRELPEHLVPSVVVALRELPRTPNGKVDRGALPAPEPMALGSGYRPPGTPVEELLAGIWSEVLGVEPIGRGEDFFALGGHSLKATQVVSRLRSVLSIELPLRALFEAPRLEDLGRRVEELVRARAEGLAGDAGAQSAGMPAAPSALAPAARRGALPLSFAQERLWLLDRIEPGGGAYHLALAQRLNGELDCSALAAALAGVVERHGVLRTRYREEEGGAVQEVSPAAGRRMGRVDLRGLAEPVRGGEARRLAREEASRPFDLAAGPVLRSALLRTGEQEHWLLLTVHHIAADGWSLGLLMGELGELYSARQAGRPAALPQLPVQYGDFAVWQRQWLSGEVLERQAAYWRERLAGMPAVLELPVDRPRPAVGSPRGGERRLALERELVASSQALARRHGATPFMLLVGALACQLGRYGGREEVAMGTPIAGRTRLEIEHLIGFFANTLVLRVDLAGEPRVGELLGRVRECALSAYAHQDLPFEKLVEQLQPVRSLGHNPLFQVMLLREETLAGGREAVGGMAEGRMAGGGVAVGEMAGAGVAGGALEGLWATPVEVETGASKFDLTVSWRGEEESGGARLRASYRRDLFDATTVQRMLGHFRTLLASMVASPEARISELALLSAAEAFQLVVEWNQTAEMSAVGEGPWSLWELLAAQAARTPEATALVAGGERWSYGELGRRAEELAVRLRSLGVGPESRVAVCLERSVELVVALWGTLLAGGAYVPLDAAYPRQRLSWIVADCGASVVVSRAALHEGLGLSGLGLPALLLEGPGERPVGCGGEPAAGWAMALPDNLAYLIYTSGSTGRPKGVAITHRSAASLVHWARRVFSDEELGGVVASTSICFDLSVFELFVPLSWGGTVVLVDDGLALARPEPAGAEEASGVRGVPVTLLNTVPSVMSELVRLAAVPSTVRVINLAGEPLRGELAARIWAGTAASRVLNLYGPSEDTTYSTWSELERGAVGEPSIGRLAGEPSIGRPVAGTRVYVLDEGLRPVGLGVTGELVLGGAGLARGYLGRPELTAERFVPDPFVAAAGERMYRTGDLGRYRVGGEIEFLGRRDHQVKVRGFRIEPGEVEVALLRQGGVEEAVVVAGEDASGERRLVAYVTPAAAVGAALRAALRRELPEHLVPSVVVALRELPRTPNGKVDRGALPAPEPMALGSGYRPPGTPVEELLAGIWSEVLGVEPIGRGEDFFALGGHSLKATQVVSRLRSVLSIELPLRALFEAPRLEDLGRRVEELVRARAEGLAGDAGAQSAGMPAAPSALAPAARRGALPLSFAQERLWLLDRLDPLSATYNLPAAWRLRGRLSAPALAAALAALARRHEALRTVFREGPGGPFQVVSAAVDARLPAVDLRHLPPTLRGRAERAIAETAARQPFELDRGPLLRGLLVLAAEAEHLLVVAAHHIVCDDWSIGIFLAELSAFYAAFLAFRPAALPELPIQYGDYAAWQRGWLRGPALAAFVERGRERLAGVPPLELPTDRPRPPLRTFRGARARFALAPTLAGDVAARCRELGATPFMLVATVLAALLHRWSGEGDFALGTPVAGRGYLELEGLIGFFVNTAVLRSRPPSGESFASAVRRLRAETLRAFADQELPFEKLVEALQPRRTLAHAPLFQVMFVFQNAPRAAAAMPGLTIEPVEVDSGVAKFDLTLVIAAAGGPLAGFLEYNRDLFDAPTAGRLTGHLAALLAAAAADPSRAASELPLLDAAERHQLVVEWNDTALGRRRRSERLDLLLAAQARRTPERAAVRCAEVEWTYGELQAWSARLAATLRRLGVGPEVRVGVLLPRSVPLVGVMVGILLAGGAYVPFDPADPAERLAFLVRDSGVTLVVTDRPGARRLPAGTRALLVDPLDTGADGADRALAEPDQPSAHDAGPDRALAAPAAPSTLVAGTDRAAPAPAVLAAAAGNLAYVVYTSGSTGEPKGVMVSHAALANLTRAFVAALALGPGDRLLMLPAASFDAAAGDLFPALTSGATLILHPDPAGLSGEELQRFCEREKVTVVDAPAALWHTWVEDMERRGERQALPALRLALSGGESLALERLSAWARITGGRAPVMGPYGPTEATVCTTLGLFTAEAPPPAGSARLPIGRPLTNTRVHLLDRGGRQVPIGVAGEIHIGGAGLARGYLGRPALTAERFLPDPLGDEPGGRLYRTGDLARQLPAGDLLFLGRVDQQVKVRGFRIEPAEVEAALLAHPRVREAAVVAREDRPGQRRLVAYLVADGDGATLAEEAGRFLRARLPGHLVPSAFVPLRALPLLPHGKVDRAALPAPAATASRTLAPARNPTEQRVAALWSELLGVAAAGVEDDFFVLGGHSLLATQLVSRLRAELGVDLPLRAVFENPTLGELAAVLDRQTEEAADGSARIARLLDEVARLSDEEVDELLART